MKKEHYKNIAKDLNIKIGKNINGHWKPKKIKELKNEIEQHNIIFNQNIYGGSSKSNYVKYLYGKKIFDISKIKKPSLHLKQKYEVQKEEKVYVDEIITEKREQAYVINNWDDVNIGAIFFNTKMGQNMETLIERKNKSRSYIIDFDLLAFTKPINDKIINQHGIDDLFNGINKIVKYLGGEKYKPLYKKQRSTPIAKYINATSRRMVNKELDNFFKDNKDENKQDINIIRANNKIIKEYNLLMKKINIYIHNRVQEIVVKLPLHKRRKDNNYNYLFPEIIKESEFKEYILNAFTKEQLMKLENDIKQTNSNADFTIGKKVITSILK